MLLKNKKTGEIKDWDFGNWYQTILNPENKEKYECNLNDFIDRTVKFREEWEDVPEEPKEWWYIECDGEVYSIDRLIGYDSNKLKEIGNYFSSREEAELGVKKFKAWKRLEDKGFRFNRWTIPEEPKTPHIKLVIEADMDVPNSPYDLDICFGGEE